MRGRKPKSAKQQIAEGDPRKRGVNKLDQQLAAQPNVERGLPSCPERLEGLARETWDLLKDALEKMELDHRPDAMELEGACTNFARAVAADEMIKAHGMVIAEPIMNRDGQRVGSKIKKHPAVGISKDCWREVRGFCSDFGFSPASLTRLSIEKSDSSSEDLIKILNASRPSKPSTSVQ